MTATNEPQQMSHKQFENLCQVFAAVDSGVEVFWESLAYKVIKHVDGDYYTTHASNHMAFIGKYHQPDSFFTK